MKGQIMRKLQFLMLSIIVLPLMVACGGVNKQVDNLDGVGPSNPATNWEGKWTQTDESDTNTFNADIESGVITINIADPDGHALYWAGTFPAMDQSKSIVSVADKAQNDASLLGSQATTKTFTYKDGILSFDFSALGVTRIIHMKHDA